jgi:hypothetical protein
VKHRIGTRCRPDTLASRSIVRHETLRSTYLELLNAQFHWNRLPALTSSHP